MRVALWCVLVSSLLGAQSVSAVDYLTDVQPLFKRRCSGCHGTVMQMNGLRLDDGESALKGSYSGAVIKPSRSAESALFLRISSTKKGFMMPPAGIRLTPPEVEIIRRWIDEGAKVPAGTAKKPDAPPVPSHWSFQPIRRPKLPVVRNRNWGRNPIDAFVLARLESEGIAPSAEAGRATLLRRLKLDLTGLPPTPAEIQEFLTDKRADYYERWVDRFLASPHFGERWARQWLDLAHYADSDGYEKDQVRPWAWRYRNWVIDALNRGLPFDRFTMAQLAGDLLPDATVEDKVATGFLTTTLTNREAGVDRAEARFEQLVSRTNTVGTVWLGLTVGCAQCHNHKYDPLTQKDYYSLMALLNSAEETQIDAPLSGESGPWLQAQPEYQRKRPEILKQYDVPSLQKRWEEKMRRAVLDPGKDLEFDFSVTSMRAMFDYADRVLLTEPGKRSERDADRLTDYFLSTLGPEFGRDKPLAAKLKEARDKLNDLKSKLPRYTQAQVMTASPEHPKTYIAVRGDYRNKGIEVTPSGPAALPAMRNAGKASRVDLAEWLVSPENPLPARVAVNRIWQEYFGRGLVRTSEDFGAQGEKPSHPELLDWLAAEFVERKWSMKAMHRLIVTSSTYRQSSAIRPELMDRDPENTLLARQSRVRLPAELIRDAALAASGLLNPAIGGPSVRPFMPAGVAELGYANSVKWKESEGTDRYRRGLYIHFQRTTPYPMLMNFDAPDSNVACSRRRVSNTPLQALNLLNDPVFHEAAKALAHRAISEVTGPFRERLDLLYALTVSRKPAETERERLGKYLDQQMALLRRENRPADTLEREAWTGLSRVLLNLDEFITRE